MDYKTFTSFKEIDKELEILRVERELNYYRLKLSSQKTRDQFTLFNVADGFLGGGGSRFIGKDTTGFLIKMAIPFILKRIFSRKK